MEGWKFGRAGWGELIQYVCVCICIFKDFPWGALHACHLVLTEKIQIGLYLFVYFNKSRSNKNRSLGTETYRKTSGQVKGVFSLRNEND